MGSGKKIPSVNRDLRQLEGHDLGKKFNTGSVMGNLGGGFKHFLFSPLPGEMIQFDEHIFQMGWFNQQLGLFQHPQCPHDVSGTIHRHLEVVPCPTWARWTLHGEKKRRLAMPHRILNGWLPLITKYHQTFQVPKMEVPNTYISCMDTAYVRESPNPHPRNSFIRFRKPSILGTWNSWW